MNKVLTVGGGASGLAAAIAAARAGAETVLLERNPRVGKKILATGNGRCNFTNVNACAKDYNSDFVSDITAEYTPEKIMGFFKNMGLMVRTEAEGRVYPASGQASAVLDVLRAEAERAGVKIITDFTVTDVRKNKKFEVFSEDGRRIEGDKLIVCTGGRAQPKSGSDGSGYDILKKFGHSITALTPSLVQIKTDKGIKGVRAYAKASLENGRSEIGEVQFNDYGLSGIPIFCLSKYVKAGMKIYLDLIPEMSKEELAEYLKRRPRQTLENFLVGILNKALGQMLLKDCGFYPLSVDSARLKPRDFERMAENMKNWEFTVKGTMPWDNAQVTSGGADTGEFDKRTLESVHVKGLYAAGEVLDVDGACGGFNLHWAWASGLTAGREAANVQN